MYLPQGFMTYGSFLAKLIGNRTKGTTSAWLPSDLSSLVAWWKADALVLDDGDDVTWTDSSANSYNLSAPTSYGMTAPTYQNDAGDLIGTKPVVRFDDSVGGSEEMLYSPSACLYDDSVQYEGMAWAVIKCNSSTGLYTTILAINEDAHLDSNYVLMGTIQVSGANYVWVCAASSSIDQSHRGSTELVDDTAYIVGWASNDSAYSLRINGSAETLTKVTGDTNNGAWFADILNMDTTCIGGLTLGNPTYFFNGDIAEIVYFNSFLSAGDVGKVESYLATKYGITI